MLPNLDLEVLRRIYKHEDDPLSILSLFNLTSIDIWSVKDLIGRLDTI